MSAVDHAYRAFVAPEEPDWAAYEAAVWAALHEKRVILPTAPESASDWRVSALSTLLGVLIVGVALLRHFESPPMLAAGAALIGIPAFR